MATYNLCSVEEMDAELNSTSKMDSNMTEYIVGPNGTQCWYLNEDLHQTDGPAIIYPDGEQAWFKNGERHREDGPAIIMPNGDQFWYLNGKLHREFGPAVIYPDGSQFCFLNGIEYKPQDKFTINSSHVKQCYE